LFMESESAKIAGESFVYRHPITGETKEGAGKAPLPWGEYPADIEPNSPDGDAYDLNRGLFRPLPDSLFVPEVLADTAAQPEGSQLDDPYWATASKILHDYMKPGESADMKSDDYANYGVRFISSFENNLGAMAINTMQLSGAPTPVHKAMYYLLETGDRDGITASGFGRAALNMATDPFNWLGLATFGIGTAGKMAGQKLTKMAFKDLLKEIVISKPTKASVALGAEGAVFAAADDLARQNVAVEAGVQDAIDPTRAAISGVTGAVLGERLGAGGGAALEAGRRGVVKAGQAADARISDRAADTGVTLTAGADPMPAIDKGLSAMGRAFDDAQARYFEQGKFEPPTAENPVSIVKPTEDKPGIIAFHGSGADFDEFRLEMIGTGEGAQAYGYGLYFTDSEDIAKFYKDAVGGKNTYRIKQFDDIGQALKGKMPLTTDVINNIIDKKIEVSSLPKEAQSSVKEILKRKKIPTTKKIYKVGLAPKPDELLDYDKSLRQQPKFAEALKPLYDEYGVAETADIGTLFESIKGARGISARDLTDRLSKAGIPGIKYATNDTRGKQFNLKLDVRGKPYRDTEPIYARNLDEAKRIEAEYKEKGFGVEIEDIRKSNYVIFDDKAVKILEKYGIVGPVAVTAAGASQTNTEAADGDT